MRQKLIDSLNFRLTTELTARNPVKFLKEIKAEDQIDLATSVVYLFTRSKGGRRRPPYMSELVSTIGHQVRSFFKLPVNSSLAAKAGAFILYTFEECGLVTVTLGEGGKSGNAAYIVLVANEDSLLKLFHSLAPQKTEKLPHTSPYKEWTEFKHETGVTLAKSFENVIIPSMRPDTHPIVYSVLNKAQKVGWIINKEVYDIQGWALRNKTDAFADIWEQHNPEAKATKLREAKAIGEIARKFLDTTFYHLYYYDFRGRKYPATAYLHEQGSDLAKGLLLRADSKPIGKDGLFWLFVSIANNWAGDAGREDGQKTDKIPLEDRSHWVEDNEEIILSYADNPKVNTGWMKADKPWQFLAACFELRKLRLFEIAGGKIEDYVSHLECYIDGSNNGSQHLSALTKDEVTAPHVNLVPLDLPGDLYKYVADHVWVKVHEEYAKIPKDKIKLLDKVIDTLLDFKHKVSEAPLKSDLRAATIKEYIEYRKEHEQLISDAAPVFWERITDGKHRRKIVKRNIMTLPYGGTPYGLGQQQIDDAKKHNIPLLIGMEHRWGSYMGRLIYEDCKESLRRPMRLLSIFEEAGKRAEANQEFLYWKVPITNFPVVQNYTEGLIKKLWIQYGPPTGVRKNTGYYDNTYQLSVCFIEEKIPSKRRQSQGASPNAIHSLDAAHLMLTVERANFPITTVHDSYGCLLADMSSLYKLIRETFVELYASEPLADLMAQINGDISSIEMGTLDISLILDSEYAFA